MNGKLSYFLRLESDKTVFEKELPLAELNLTAKPSQ
jgi:hypothetical protein